jgi:NAD(P)H-dependent FMN reductase/ketosteroid isomerase-like protein
MSSTMVDHPKVAVLVGSLRKGSLSRKVAGALMACAPPSIACTVVEIADLPLYDEDREDDVPRTWSRFRTEIAGASAVLFVTPEYNRSIPGGLKNAMDVGSRPHGRSVFDGLPAAVVSVSPYRTGAFGANHALRQSLVFLNMPVMQQPEAYVGEAVEAFDDAGRLRSGEVEELFTRFMAAFARWIDVARVGPRAEDFEEFMKRRVEAAAAYVTGNASLVDALAVQRGTASFFHPRGDVITGADEVIARYNRDAGRFAPGGSGHLEILQHGVCGDVAFWTGFQIAEARMRANPDVVVPMKLRVTEVFRLVDGRWLMVHRHADAGADKAGG